MIQASLSATPDAGELRKKLPIGLSNYKKVIDGGYYYIDKTLFIADILEHGGEVTLIARPRRFGKTLNLSMLKYFFEKTARSNAYLFEDKKIWQLPEYAALQGKFPVIFLTFKDIKENTWQNTRSKLISTIAAEYTRHKYLLESELLDENEKVIFKNICAEIASDVHYQNSLKNLSEFLYRFYEVNSYVLLDEYDSPIHAGFTHGYYDDIIEFMRGLMVGVFKDNDYLECGVITGILRMAKEGIFSGLNNVEVFTVLDTQMSDKFGFTQQEIEQFLQDYKLDKIRDEFKNWYNGYLIGDTKIYNPWSVLNCIKRRGEFSPYWANTSDNALIHKVIMQAEIDFKDACADLIRGKVVENIEINPQITLSEISQEHNAIWSLLLFSGYVTPHPYRNVKGVIYVDFILPNEELHLLFKKLINDAFYKSLNSNEINELNNALQKADGETFEYLFSKFITQSMSVYDISSDEPEKSYHLFALGLLVILTDHYIVLSNRESGFGRFDIMLIPKEKSKPGIIIEFKKMSAKETMSECADRALEQIKERNYAAQLHQHDIKRIVAFGIAIHKKEVLLKQEEL